MPPYHLCFPSCVGWQPYLWEDSRGNFHFLAHRYDYRDGWPVNPNQTMPILVSGHGFSRDGVDWHFNQAEQVGGCFMARLLLHFQRFHESHETRNV